MTDVRGQRLTVLELSRALGFAVDDENYILRNAGYEAVARLIECDLAACEYPAVNQAIRLSRMPRVLLEIDIVSIHDDAAPERIDEIIQTVRARACESMLLSVKDDPDKTEFQPGLGFDTQLRRTVR